MKSNPSPFKWRHCAPDVILLYNVVEQDDRFIKKKVRASQCFKRLRTAERTVEGVEAMSMTRKGQVTRLAGSDARGRAKFVASLFQLAA
jgi:transposase-like protein